MRARWPLVVAAAISIQWAQATATDRIARPDDLSLPDPFWPIMFTAAAVALVADWLWFDPCSRLAARRRIHAIAGMVYAAVFGYRALALFLEDPDDPRYTLWLLLVVHAFRAWSPPPTHLGRPQTCER